MKLIVFFGIYIGYLLIASKVFQKFELSEYEKRCTEGARFKARLGTRSRRVGWCVGERERPWTEKSQRKNTKI